MASNANTTTLNFNPGPGNSMVPLSVTREQSIADSVTSTSAIQAAFPDIDFKTAVIEPTVNMAFDLKVLSLPL